MFCGADSKCVSTVSCSPSGTCTYTCDTGYYECDGIFSTDNGCESQTPCSIYTFQRYTFNLSSYNMDYVSEIKYCWEGKYSSTGGSSSGLLQWYNVNLASWTTDQSISTTEGIWCKSFTGTSINDFYNSTSKLVMFAVKGAQSKTGHSLTLYADFVNLTIIYAAPPKYVEGTNSTNSTGAGSPVEFRLKWTDDVGLDHYIFSLDNCTGSFKNLTSSDILQKTEWSGNTEDWSNVTVRINDTWNCEIRWKVYANDTSDNWNVSDTYSFTTSECSVAIGLSNTLANGILFGNTAPGEAKDALGNNGEGLTDYNITLQISGCSPNTVDVYLKANDDLRTLTGYYFIGLGNETFRNSTSDATVPASLQNISLTTNYADNKIGSSLPDNSHVYLKFVLNVPVNQWAATYNNTIYICGERSGSNLC